MNAIFFDFDGTLVDSRADLAETVNHTRRDLGLKELPLEEVIRHIGLGAKRLVLDTIPERNPGEEDALVERFLGHYAEHMLDHCMLYPGVADTIAKLRERGFLLGINTAKPRFAVFEILRRIGLDGAFGDAVVAGGDCAEMKPSAAPLVECAQRMGHALSGGDWMVGDNWTDMQCAVNAGVKGAFCDFGFGQLCDSPCDVRLACFADILDAV